MVVPDQGSATPDARRLSGQPIHVDTDSSMPRATENREELIDTILDINSEQRSEIRRLMTHNQNLIHDNAWLRQTLAQNNNLIAEMRGTIQVLQSTRLQVEAEDRARAQTRRLLDFILAAQDPSPETVGRRIERLQSQHDIDQQTITSLRRNDTIGLRSEVTRLEEEVGRLRGIIVELQGREFRLRQELSRERVRNEKPKVAFTTVNRSPSKKLSSKH